jgi:hypothetical protein
VTDVVPSRNIIQQEEVAYRASVSEATMTRIGALNNFHAFFQHNRHDWHINGAVGQALGTQGPDGVFTCLFNMEIVGYSFYHGLGGINGQSIIDLHWLSNGGTDEGSIWTTRPQIDSTASDQAYGVFNQLDNVAVVEPTGVSLGELSKTQFVAGDAIRFDVDDVMAGSNNLQFTIMYRPID